ncbi:MAG: cytochrome c3 family protein [Acidobacteria bacterium]|nr:cytochrome c3 family protein [Acidobacteriota bacterium]MBI3423357.1 cytochrome c3 family protein [Acidobacteriota bacterium]
MKLKLLITVLYLLALAWPALPSLPSLLNVRAALLPQVQTADLFFDRNGKRGLVRFNHKQHEGLLTRAPNLAHQAPPTLACVGCHHTTQNILKREQFQKCSDCHRAQGFPDNPVPAAQNVRSEDDRDIELNSREIFHRLCISCHRDEKPRAENATKKIPVTCNECHDRNATAPEIVASSLIPPPADDAPTGEGLPKPLPTGSVSTPVDAPQGYAGKSRIEQPDLKGEPDANAVARPDRWRISFPDDPRLKKGALKNPYNQNVLKGDYPIFGQHNYLVLTLESESMFNGRRIPLPSNVSSERPNSTEFFGRGGQVFFNQNFITSVEFFHGDTSFKPVDYRFKFTPVFNLNLLHTQERSIVNINPVIGASRFDSYIGFQELFGEARLGDTTKFIPWLRGKGNQDGKSPHFDSTFIRAGIQQFNSDFRGFIFNDYNLGGRLFGQFANNRYNFNAAAFYMLDKDTNSGLNTRFFTRLANDRRNEWRNQLVVIANLYRQDTKWKGYTTQFSFHYNDDRPSRVYDQNDFLVRPALIGTIKDHGVKSYYLGFTGDGHIGLTNINHAFYQVLGRDSFNPIAGRKTDINAQMAAVELSRDRDWLRFKGSVFWASGDSKPFDGKARGFDSILDLTEFAGGKFSFWNSQAIPFLNTGVLLTTPESLVPSLRSSKTQGQSNFVNPGIFIYNAGLEAELKPKLRAILNLNYLHFHHTEPLSQLLFQPGIRRPIGLDYGVGFLYRPLLSENVIVTGGYSSLLPGTGFKDIFSSNCAGQGCGAKPQMLYSVFVKVKFTY